MLFFPNLACFEIGVGTIWNKKFNLDNILILLLQKVPAKKVLTFCTFQDLALFPSKFFIIVLKNVFITPWQIHWVTARLFLHQVFFFSSYYLCFLFIDSVLRKVANFLKFLTSTALQSLMIASLLVVHNLHTISCCIPFLEFWSKLFVLSDLACQNF